MSKKKKKTFNLFQQHYEHLSVFTEDSKKLTELPGC